MLHVTSWSVMAFAIVTANLIHISTASSSSTALSSALQATEKSALRAFREVYTTNAICTKKHCVNPVFPGMEDLQRLEQSVWMTSSLRQTSPSMRFCKAAVDYDPALPATTDEIQRLVQRQDDAAATTFYYHVFALGMEAWDHQEPWKGSDCVKSIWRMACYTYFPRAEVGTMNGAYSKYVRPCQSSCSNYVRQCGVECCDESVQCVFSHTKAISNTQNVTSEGYSPHDGPSSLCTGGARPSARPLGAGLWALVILQVLFSFEGSVRSLFKGSGGRRLLLVGCVLVAALSLQGCAYDVPIHRVGNWRMESDYLIRNQFIPPGGSAHGGTLNSCSFERISVALQCSGRGACRKWNDAMPKESASFCQCDRDWADPECRTRRQSQAVAYILSVFLGMFGADQFYLGFKSLGFAKLFTLGGGGVWWVYDIIRIGSGPVQASTYRVAADLPHGAFVLSSVMFAGFVGFAAAYKITTTVRARKRKEALFMLEEEEAQKNKAVLFADAYQTQQVRNNSGAQGRQTQFNPSQPILSRLVQGSSPRSMYGAMPAQMKPNGMWMP